MRQLIRFSPYQLNLWGVNPVFVAELVFLAIHPNLACESSMLSVREPIYEQYLSISTNNILEIVMLARIYLVYSAIVCSTIYLSTRGSRICRIYGTKCNLYFGFKCLFNTRPLFFLVVIFITMLFVFGEMVRLSEENVPSSTLGIFGNSLWCVMITMGTVGYGDYYPQTYLGRVILFFASITGIIIASLLILTLSTYLSMELSENKAHITMHRLVLRDRMEDLAKGVMRKTAVLSQLPASQGERELKGLKKQSDDVKYTLRKIKNLIDTDNINEEMDRLFESLEDNMKDAYLNQVRYAEALQQMHEVEAEKINEMKFSFT